MSGYTARSIERTFSQADFLTGYLRYFCGTHYFVIDTADNSKQYACPDEVVIPQPLFHTH
jgi:hypothetical protein